MPALLEPGGGLGIGHGQQVCRPLEVLDVAVLRDHGLLAVGVDDGGVGDGDAHVVFQKNTSVKRLLPGTPWSRRISNASTIMPRLPQR